VDPELCCGFCICLSSRGLVRRGFCWCCLSFSFFVSFFFSCCDFGLLCSGHFCLLVVFSGALCVHCLFSCFFSVDMFCFFAFLFFFFFPFVFFSFFCFILFLFFFFILLIFFFCAVPSLFFSCSVFFFFGLLCFFFDVFFFLLFFISCFCCLFCGLIFFSSFLFFCFLFFLFVFCWVFGFDISFCCFGVVWVGVGYGVLACSGLGDSTRRSRGVGDWLPLFCVPLVVVLFFGFCCFGFFFRAAGILWRHVYFQQSAGVYLVWHVFGDVLGGVVCFFGCALAQAGVH